jgi:hypothetical protein
MLPSGLTGMSGAKHQTEWRKHAESRVSRALICRRALVMARERLNAPIRVVLAVPNASLTPRTSFETERLAVEAPFAVVPKTPAQIDQRATETGLIPGRRSRTRRVRPGRPGSSRLARRSNSPARPGRRSG